MWIHKETQREQKDKEKLELHRHAEFFGEAEQ